MSATVVLGEHLDILMALAAVDFVLDAEVGEVHAVVEVRQLVFCRPAANLLLRAVRSSVAVGPVAVVVLQKLLILPLQILFKHDAVDIDMVVLLSEMGFFFAIRGIQMGVVIQFSWAVDAGVELLGPALVALSAIGVEQVPALDREDDRMLAFAKRDGPSQTFVAQVVQRVVILGIVPVAPEITLGNDPERTDGR